MKLLAALAVLVLLAVVADVVAEETAETRIGKRLSSSIEGAGTAEVEVRGRPFLLQVVRGSFSGLDVHLASVQRGGIEVEDVELALRDVEFSVGELVDGSGDVQVDGGRGSGKIDQRSLNAALQREGLDARVSLNGNRATASVAGREADVEGVAIAGGALEFRSAAFLGDARIPLPLFLEGIDYRDARVQDSRVVVSLELPQTSLDPGSL